MPMRPEDYDWRLNGELEILWTAAHIPREGDRPFVFFDVGANRGEWTNIAIQQEQQYEGHLFDISPECFDILTETFGSLPGLRINPFGLSHESATMEYKHFTTDETLNTLIADMDFWDGQREGVVGTTTVRTGDDYCTEHGIEFIDMLKIDCEGWDWFVLQGFDRMLSEKRVGIIQFEYGYTTADIHIVMRDFWRYLEGHGYKVGPLRKEGVHFQPFNYWFNNFESGPNFVAIEPSKHDDMVRLVDAPPPDKSGRATAVIVGGDA